MRATAQILEVLGSGPRPARNAEDLKEWIREGFSRWLHTANRALGGQMPLQLLDTDLGSRQVEEILGRIEYGVFS